METLTSTATTDVACNHGFRWPHPARTHPDQVPPAIQEWLVSVVGIEKYLVYGRGGVGNR